MKQDTVPKQILNTKYRKEMWRNAKIIINKLEKILPISAAYLLGSFTTDKKRPADVDVIILLKTKKNVKSKWSVDFVVCPDNKYGEYVVKDAGKWMKQKYGAKNSKFIQLK